MAAQEPVTGLPTDRDVKREWVRGLLDSAQDPERIAALRATLAELDTGAVLPAGPPGRPLADVIQAMGLPLPDWDRP